FSYSLSMIPDWCAALERAWEMLRPGGTIGVVDFYISHKHPAPGRIGHSWLTRAFWPLWFGADNVLLCPAMLDWLPRRFEVQSLQERRAPVPYIPLGRVPWFSFVGRKPVS